MTTGIVIVGCGGFGREVFSLIVEINGYAPPIWTVEGFVDDCPSSEDKERVQILGSRILGPIATIRNSTLYSSAVIAIGSPSARVRVAEYFEGSRVKFPPLVHPAATVGCGVTLGAGVVIAAGARLSTNIMLGAHVQIDQNVTVGHDTQIGDYSRLNPQACISGSVSIGKAVLIGANAVILPTVHVGNGSTVGAQSCVVHDVPDQTVVKGVPAR